MGREIERKWTWHYGYGIEELYGWIDFFESEGEYGTEIKDYYFNKNCRLRCVGGKDWFVTIKSDGNLVRDEFEYRIDKNEIDFIPSPMIEKTRYKFVNTNLTFVTNNCFELNVFKNIVVGVPSADGTIVNAPLITIEVELPSPTIHFTPDMLPPFVGAEITYDEEFYGYNLFEMLQKTLKSKKTASVDKNKIILFPKKENI